MFNYFSHCIIQFVLLHIFDDFVLLYYKLHEINVYGVKQMPFLLLGQHYICFPYETQVTSNDSERSLGPISSSPLPCPFIPPSSFNLTALQCC